MSESLTRVIENLPFLLCKKITFSTSKKEDMVSEALCFYLKNTKDHHLIKQQKSYYDILGNIRHRKSSAYEMYNKDSALFKAFVIQLEAYIYILITFESEM